MEQAVGVARRAKWVGCGDGQIELRKFPNTSTWKAWDTKADYPAIIGWGIGQIRYLRLMFSDGVVCQGLGCQLVGYWTLREGT